MRSRMCGLLHIDYPIFAFTHCRDVVADCQCTRSAAGLAIPGDS
jgi:hypothetical protein